MSEGVKQALLGDNKRTLFKRLFQLVHLVLATGILLTGFAEFAVEPTIFDIFGKATDSRSTLLQRVFQNGSINSKSIGHVLDAPILVLFLIYWLSILWLKCHGVFAWLLTASQVVSMLMYLGVNAGLSPGILEWSYFSTRGIIILLDVLILSFSWTVLVVTLLHIRGWFPFKVKKYRDIPYTKRTPVQKVMVIVWNWIALYMVLGLCLLIWFSKLYMSWTCVRDKTEILLMCQFTNMVQCWPCRDDTNGCNVKNITECIQEYELYPNGDGPIRCISPLYSVPKFSSAFCVFNYNIGVFTFVTVFSYVGGIYFFMRTVLNALVKCLFSIGFVAIHVLLRFSERKQDPEKGKEAVSVNEAPDGRETSETTFPVTSDPRVSLLGPLPYYGNKTRTKYS